MFLFSCWLHEIFIFISLTASCRRFKCFYEGVVDILLYLTKGPSFPKTLDPKYLYLNMPQFARYPIFPKFHSSKTSVPPVPPDTLCSQYSNFCVTFFFSFPVFSFRDYRPSQHLPPTQCAFAQLHCSGVAIRHSLILLPLQEVPA